MAEARKLMPRLETATDPYACIEGADAMLILTEWDQFRALDLDRVKTALRSPVVIDLRNIYRPAEVAAKGLTYVGVGQTVTIDFSLSFKPQAAGQTFSVEAFAIDDDGNQQGFESVGTITVSPRSDDQ